MTEKRFWTSEPGLLTSNLMSSSSINVYSINGTLKTVKYYVSPNDDIKNIQLVGYTLYWQDRTAASGKTQGGGLCIYVNNSWGMISKEISTFCLPKVEYLIINCRPHYLPREFLYFS
jgi:hypothetical protein